MKLNEILETLNKIIQSDVEMTDYPEVQFFLGSPTQQQQVMLSAIGLYKKKDSNEEFKIFFGLSSVQFIDPDMTVKH